LTIAPESAILPTMRNELGAFFSNPVFWAGFCGWMIASLLKMSSNLIRTGKIDFHYLAALGGMPSAHSAMISGLATAVGLQNGFGSTLFVITFAVAAVVMFDASTVRRATGLQARLLNQIVDEIFKQHHLSTQKLKEILGHTRTEVFAGMLVGIASGITVNFIAR
jgi:acid phosphatase family membrane protein YuiD